MLQVSLSPPRHLTLAISPDPSVMNVGFSSANASLVGAMVQWGHKPSNLSFSNPASGYLWTDHYAPYQSYQFVSNLTDLAEGMTYYYRAGIYEAGDAKCSQGVGQEHIYPGCQTGWAWSSTFSYTHHPDPQTTPLTYVVFGDMGEDNGQSMAALEAEVMEGNLHAVFHIGDFAYDFCFDAGRSRRRPRPTPHAPTLTRPGPGPVMPWQRPHSLAHVLSLRLCVSVCLCVLICRG